MHPQHILSPAAVARLLAIRDLTDPGQGRHAMQRSLWSAVAGAAAEAPCDVVTHRSGPIVSRLDDDRLGWREDGAPAGAPRRVSPVRVLRSRMASSMPAVLRQLTIPPDRELLVVCAGTVHRPYASARGASRDARAAVVPHEAELWRLRRGPAYSLRDVGRAIGAVARATVPGLAVSAAPCTVAHLAEARTADVRVRGAWLEIGRCGTVDPELLSDLRVPAGTAALAMTLGLDRLVMLAKGIDDARVLRAREPSVAAQMADLEPYVSPALAGQAAPGERRRAVATERRPGYVTARLRG